MSNTQDFVIENGVLKKYTGRRRNVVIPEGVTEIGENAFYKRTGLTSVTIPESVTEIKDYAFFNCTRLQQVTIPDGVTKIGEGAFFICESLTNMVIPESVTQIGLGAFNGCSRLASVMLPAGLTKISINLFSGCANLQSVMIPKRVTKIGDNAFDNCTGLTSVTIPKSVREIGSFAFSHTGLTHITIPEGVTEIGTETFSYTGLTSVTIPEGVERIALSAFWGCTSLRSVTFLGDIPEMNKKTFKDCSPALFASRAPIVDFLPEHRPGAVQGFAKLYLEGVELDEEIKAGYLKYIKANKKKLYPHAVRHEELLQFMFAERIVTRKDIDLLLEECDKQNNITAKAAVLEYAGKNLKPVDPMKEFKL